MYFLAACRWEHCSEEFEAAADESGDWALEESGGEDASSWALCQALHTHIHCLRSLSKSCRGKHLHALMSNKSIILFICPLNRKLSIRWLHVLK